MTPFQRYMWRRRGFIITDNHRAQTIRGVRYGPSTVVERGSGARPSTGYEGQLWGMLRRLWQEKHPRKVSAHGGRERSGT